MSHPQGQMPRSPSETAQNTEPTETEEADIFDSILSLEDQYHNEGYNLGVADGARAGRTEGRLFGMEKGFEKFVEMGRLGGKAAVWSARLHNEGPTQPTTVRNERLRKHVDRLAELTDPDTLSTSNNEEAVSDFDERLVGAQAKTRLISNTLGSSDHGPAGRVQDSLDNYGTDANVITRPTTGSATSSNRRRAPLRNSEMEDFAGLPRASNGKVA